MYIYILLTAVVLELTFTPIESRFQHQGTTMPVVPCREPFTSGLEKGVPWEVVQTTRLKHESFFVDSS